MSKCIIAGRMLTFISFCRAEYELTAVIALVQEEQSPSPQGQVKGFPEAEGHLVAHVQVQPHWSLTVLEE